MLIKPTMNEDAIENRGAWGIDKVKIYLLNDSLNLPTLESSVWHYDAKRTTLLHTLISNKYVELERTSNGTYLLIIHQEYFTFSTDKTNQFNQIWRQIQSAIDLLLEEELILSGKTYGQCIGHITELELYFSMRDDYIEVIQECVFNTQDEAKINGGLYRYGDTDTYYSYNGIEGSSVCFYNKANKDIHDNLYSREEINNFPYTRRLEFRLRGEDVRDYSKLNATIDTVFTNYLNTIAFLHNKYLKNNMQFNIPVRNKYMRVLNRAEEVTSIRNTKR